MSGCDPRKARENVHLYVAITFGFASHCLSTSQRATQQHKKPNHFPVFVVNPFHKGVECYMFGNV